MKMNTIRASVVVPLLMVLWSVAATAQAEDSYSQPMVAPPPPRLIDSETGADSMPALPAAANDDGTLSPAQRQRCEDLLNQINALPSGPQWSVGRSSVTTADGRTYPTLERQADRKRLQEAYRQECAQRRR